MKQHCLIKLLRYNVLGLFDWGGVAYHKLYQKAKNEFGADQGF